LKIDNTQINAAVTTIIPAAEIADIILITLCDFFENKYRRAIKNANLKLYFEVVLLSVIVIFW
jgi:hypothetical protein